MTKRYITWLLVFSAFFSIFLAAHTSIDVYASEIDAPCADIEVVFAPGSGQGVNSVGSLNTSKEYDVFAKKAEEYLKNLNISLHPYRLGTDYQYGMPGKESVGYRYPAVPITGSLLATATAADARVYGDNAGVYRWSVENGIAELRLYIKNRITKCPNSKYILAGYSQGAQVVGEYLTKYSDAISFRHYINYVALFGDPKLYLPEGRVAMWPFGRPPACDSPNSFSPYRAGRIKCEVMEGSLTARDPYLPSSYFLNTGAWCHDHDFVCGSTLNLNDVGGHSTYHSKNNGENTTASSIEQGVQKSLFAVAGKLDELSRKKLLYSIRNGGNAPPNVPWEALPPIAYHEPNKEPPALELPQTRPCVKMLLFIKEGLYDWARDQLIAKQIRNINDNYGVMECYTGVATVSGTGHPSILLQPTNDVDSYLAVLNRLPTVPQLPTPELDIFGRPIDNRPEIYLHEAVDAVYEDTRWKDIISEPFVSIDVVKGAYEPRWYWDTVYQEQDTIRIYKDSNIDVDAYSGDNCNKSTATGYKKDVPINAAVYCTGIYHVEPPRIAQIDESPMPIAEAPVMSPHHNMLPQIESATGQQIALKNTTTFLSVRPTNPTYSINDYTQFKWDFDANGTIDNTTTTPYISHVFTTSGPNIVRVTGSYDNRFMAQVDIPIQVVDSEPVKFSVPIRDMAATNTSPDSIQLTWSSAPVSSYAIYIDDFAIARVDGGQQSVNIDNIDLANAKTVGVAAIDSSGMVGKRYTIPLPEGVAALDTAPDTPAPSPQGLPDTAPAALQRSQSDNTSILPDEFLSPTQYTPSLPITNQKPENPPEPAAKQDNILSYLFFILLVLFAVAARIWRTQSKSSV